MNSSVTLTAGQSYNLTTRRVERPRTAPGPMDRPVRPSLADNDLRTFYAAIRRTHNRPVFCQTHPGLHSRSSHCTFALTADTRPQWIAQRTR